MKRHFKRSLILLFALSLLAGSSYAQEKSPKRQDNVEPKITGKRKAAVNKNTGESAKPSTRTVMFYINDTTGEISGCPFLKKLERGPIVDFQAAENDSVFSKIREEIIQRWQQKDDAGYSTVYPYGIYSPDKRYLAVVIYEHGGITTAIRFYDNKGGLSNELKFDKPLFLTNVPRFQTSQNYLTIIDAEGQFYVTSKEGRLKIQGDVNQILGTNFFDHFGTIAVSKNISKILLSFNNKTLILDGQLKILKIDNQYTNDAYFSEHKELLYTVKNGSQLFCQSTNNYSTLYASNKLKWPIVFYRNIIMYSNLTKDYYYEMY